MLNKKPISRVKVGIPKSRRQWQFQEAKAKLAEVLDDTLAVGPQVITRRGKPVAAMIAIEDLPKVLTAKQSDDNRPGALLACLQRAPASLAELDLRRDKTPVSTDSIFE